MALICDPDYLIHNLRLSYLRHVDDPYGPRLISFSPRYTSNAHVVASGLGDADRWPELLLPQSPQVSDEEETNAPNGKRVRPGFPGATGLKYTQTIMGPSRIGALGMRVSGKRAMTAKDPVPPVISVKDTNSKRTRADSEPTPVPMASTSPVPDPTPGSPETTDESLIHISKRRSAGGTSLSEVAPILVERDEQENSDGPQTSSTDHHATQDVSYISAMQARRQRRRARFLSSGGNAVGQIVLPEVKINQGDSSEEEIEITSGSLPDDDYIEHVGDDLLDAEAEDFDPDFAPPRIGIVSDGSDQVHSVPNSALSTSNSSVYNAPQQAAAITKDTLNSKPVNAVVTSGSRLIRDALKHSNRSDSDGDLSDSTTQARGEDSGTPIDSLFEIVQPPVPERPPEKTLKSQNSEVRLRGSQHNNGRSAPAPSPADLLFARRRVPLARPVSSALTAKLASSNTSSNPFTELYALISGRAEVASMKITVFFPHARKPIGKPLELNVRKDASVEEVVGFALWSYWEEGWLPKLDEGIGSDEQKRKIKLSALGWVLRIAEDDGEVDEDFPAPDRMGKISKFNLDAYAILEATTSQIAQNQQLEAKIVRRPSRIIMAKKKVESSGLTPTPSLGPSSSAMSGSALATSLGLPTSLGIASSQGPQVLLRIRVEDATNGAVHYSTTISVSSVVYMQEVLEHICRKRKLDNPKEWALLSKDFKTLILLDRTIASLEGSSELALVRRSSLPSYGFPLDGDRRAGRSTDPNASIFKRISEVQPKSKITDLDFNAYKRYTVYRKVPMLVARLERTLAVDGDYIHIMPSANANKARKVFDNGKTVSYHVKSVVSCSQSAKNSASFKIIFKRDGGDKRYDFEAESPKLAAEIVKALRHKCGLERSATVSKLRRSRQVV